jgi:hypothetical protein
MEMWSAAPASYVVLARADGKSIHTWGLITVELCLGGKLFFCSYLLVAAAKFHLLVDPFAVTT